jgi:serine/threonine protein kinase
VAVKRVLPPIIKGHGSNGSLKSPSREDGAHSGSAEIHDVKATTKNEGTAPRRGNRGKSVRINTENAVDLESGNSLSKIGGTKAGGSLSGSNKDWEQLLNLRHSDNDILRLLESATGSSHGSDTVLGSVSKNHIVLRYVPLWMRWDEHSVRIREFQTEMRMISRLRVSVASCMTYPNHSFKNSQFLVSSSQHPCITTVMGAVVSNRVDPMLVLEFMEYGSLYDLLRNETMTLNGELILQIGRDIVQGIQFLHASKPPILHGDLKAKNILVDSRFRAKVADFGFSRMKTSKVSNIIRGTPYYMAPEYIRRRSEYTTHCDIYSLAMVIYEIYARKGPFEGEDPRKVLPKICNPRYNKRPSIPEACPPKMVDLMKKCWGANACFRPQAKDMDYLLVEMNSQDTEPLKTKDELAREFVKRKPTSLLDVFPKKVAEALNAGKKVEAETHDLVSIFFSDIVGFTTISQTRDAMKVSNMLDRLYTVFDNLSKQHNVFKVETIGDAWMGVTNLDNDHCESHARQIAEFAMDAIRAATKIPIDEDDLSIGYLNIRVGLHSGPVVANVVGTLNPRYGLFGDTVNTASRMESNSLPGRVHCSAVTADLLKQQAADIRLELRGMVEIKGKGKMKTFWVGPENLALLPASSFPAHGMPPLSERDDEDHIDTQNDLSESEHVSELNDSFHGDDETGFWDTHKDRESHPTTSTKNLANTMVLSERTSATDSVSSEGSNSGRIHPSSVKSHLGKHHDPVTISMDGSVQSVPTDE